jgi:hypothetical protein
MVLPIQRLTCAKQALSTGIRLGPFSGLRATANVDPMGQVSLRMRSVARRLVALEANGNNTARTTKLFTFDVCEKLRPQLVTLMGTGGYRALLSRALALASAEVPWLRTAQVKADGELEKLEELSARLDPDALLEGKTELLAQLLGLLEAFIGVDLTLRLMREVWPKARFNDLQSDKGDQNETTK